ncbi:hypothetical protein RM69_08545, partial [Mesotoga sp. SC_NapDC3]
PADRFERASSLDRPRKRVRSSFQSENLFFVLGQGQNQEQDAETRMKGERGYRVQVMGAVKRND